MIYGSVCSGIEAASVAWKPLGWKPAFFSEIDKFPSAVLAHHYGSNMPGEPLAGANSVPNLGDMTQFKEWPDHAIDILVGGTPCQSFSVAGLRQGLNDPRGNLMLTFGAIAKRYRPKWLVWENVPGVLSSNGGRDFGAFLWLLGKLGYGFAYRVLDTQFVRVDGFGRAIPQRRRRVFVVGYLGDWRRAAAVLFEPESMSGNIAPRREARERVTAGTLRSTDGGSDVDHARANHLIPFTKQAHGEYCEQNVSSTVSARDFKDATDLIAFSSKDYGADAIRAASGGSSRSYIAQAWAVRRLTPRECERLQGFRDDYTQIPWRGKPASSCPDGPRYKVCGNSMAVPVMRWIGTRIQMIEELEL